MLLAVSGNRLAVSGNGENYRIGVELWTLLSCVRSLTSIMKFVVLRNS